MGKEWDFFLQAHSQNRRSLETESNEANIARVRSCLYITIRGGYRFAKLIETNILEQISMLEHILRLFSIESKWFPSNLALIPDL